MTLSVNEDIPRFIQIIKEEIAKNKIPDFKNKFVSSSKRIKKLKVELKYQAESIDELKKAILLKNNSRKDIFDTITSKYDRS